MTERIGRQIFCPGEGCGAVVHIFVQSIEQSPEMWYHYEIFCNKKQKEVNE